MSVTVNMPQLGETVTEGTILSWAKQPGDSISEDEVLLEISTDKVDTEVPSPAAGVIREILVPEGETVSVGTPLVVISEPGEDGGEAPAADAEPRTEEAEAASTAEPEPEPEAEPEPEPEAEAEPEPAHDGGKAGAAPEPAGGGSQVSAPEPDEDAPRRGILSPVVRKLAADYGLDLDEVPGTGAGGRITRKDVMNYVESDREEAPAAKVTLEPAPEPAEAPPEPAPAAEEAPATAEEPAATPEPPAAVPEEPAPAAPQAPVKPSAAPTPATGDEVVEITRLRRSIAENMIRSKQTAAHVWTSVEVDFENVERVRRAHRAEFKDREGFSLTYLPFISRATMDALRAYPVVNSSLNLEEGTAIFHGAINLGIAVDLNEGGLIVTTIRDADQLRMTGLAREIRRLAAKTRGGDIELDDITGSTFTITNPGPFGSYMSAPIINVPNVAILSTDTVEKRATVVTLSDGSDGIAIHPIGYLGLTWDHRAFDGSTAVLFLNRIKENLETWDWEQELK